ncbi:hypothetical protein ASE21_20250 [Flavobacterium sp. Root901]|uniref:hypothetical protein n=1 Tax=Flavobacterium sp. Root901 TaxID=1736605 RepID=UPI00070B4885|nr:hypothetical protein [Flavobacterium sp. Root901]KRD06489.1 hypothetical protein ASE21_20250 [Flavobacterium sp. Root901]
MKFNIKILVIIPLFLVSCDAETGTDGVVIDAISGERLKDVTVKMTSEQGDKEDISSVNGYFSIILGYGCGIAKCEGNPQITFTKEGYNTLEINESYYDSKSAQYLNQEKKIL